MLEQHSYLLHNQMNPFPISGQLTLSDDGELSFRLDEKAAQASLGWLEKATGISGLKALIQGGERPSSSVSGSATTRSAGPRPSVGTR